MRVLTVSLILFGAPAFAADYTPWESAGGAKIAESRTIQLARKPPDACCMQCTKGKPCGNSCIATNKKCNQPPGCAC